MVFIFHGKMQDTSLISLFLLSAIIYRGYAIECYNCGDCGNGQMVLADCSDVGGSGLDFESISCMRSKTASGVVSRSCGMKKLRELVNINSGCVEANGATVCVCETSACNGGDDWSASSYSSPSDDDWSANSYSPPSDDDWSANSPDNSGTVHFYYFSPIGLLLIIPCCIAGCRKKRPTQASRSTVAHATHTRAEQGRAGSSSFYSPPAYSNGYDQPKSDAPTFEQLPSHLQSIDATGTSSNYPATMGTNSSSLNDKKLQLNIPEFMVGPPSVRE